MYLRDQLLLRLFRGTAVIGARVTAGLVENALGKTTVAPVGELATGVIVVLPQQI